MQLRWLPRATMRAVTPRWRQLPAPLHHRGMVDASAYSAPAEYAADVLGDRSCTVSRCVPFLSWCVGTPLRSSPSSSLPPPPSCSLSSCPPRAEPLPSLSAALRWKAMHSRWFGPTVTAVASTTFGCGTTARAFLTPTRGSVRSTTCILSETSRR